VFSSICASQRQQLQHRQAEQAAAAALAVANQGLLILL
jgi:hypothetical protein